MGRRKITIKQIADPKLRHITFNKRKNGLIKKAAELAVLCNVNMLLVFEDSNGNLIQFTREAIQDIPDFFQQLRYNNVLEFSAQQYPTFFKVNHYKKNKDRDMEDDYDHSDDMEYAEEDDCNSPVYVEETQEMKPYKKLRVQASNDIKEEDHMIYQSGDEQGENINSNNNINEDLGNLTGYTNEQAKPILQLEEKPKSFQRVRAKPNKPEETQEQKMYINEEEEQLMTPIPEQEIVMNRKESFSSFREVSQRVRIEKSIEYQPQFNGFENSFRRTNQINEQNTSFRYYPSDNNNNMNRQKIVNNNNFNNVSKIQNNSHFMNNNVNNMNMMSANNNNTINIRQNFHRNQIQRHQNHNGIKRHFNPHKAAILQGFANMNNMNGMVNMNMGNMQNMGNMNGMNMNNEETISAMLKGLPSLGFMGGANGYVAKGGNKGDMDEKLLDTANMIKYLNSSNNNNNFNTSKIYNFQNSENGKNTENDNMYNQTENVTYDNESEFNDQQQFMRGEFRLDSNLNSNLPSAYFSSKKFNFDGYFNNFEEDKFNEFGDPKKKQTKQA